MSPFQKLRGDRVKLFHINMSVRETAMEGRLYRTKLEQYKVFYYLSCIVFEDIVAARSILTDLSKQCRPRSDVAEPGV